MGDPKKKMSLDDVSDDWLADLLAEDAGIPESKRKKAKEKIREGLQKRKTVFGGVGIGTRKQLEELEKNE